MLYTSLFKHFSWTADLPTQGHVRSALHVLYTHTSHTSCAYFIELKMGCSNRCHERFNLKKP